MPRGSPARGAEQHVPCADPPPSQVHIHPAIPPGTAEEMAAAAEAAVVSALPPSRVGLDVLLHEPPSAPPLKL